MLQISVKRKFQSPTLILLDAFLGNEMGEMFKGPIVSAFGIRRKKAGRKLPAAEVVAQAFTASAFFGTRFIGAVAFFPIFRLVAVH
jgi:hypothetical protein